jgi:hypothetical protein
MVFFGSHDAVLAAFDHLNCSRLTAAGPEKSASSLGV